MPRAVVVVEAMAAITIADALLMNIGARMDRITDFYKKLYLCLIVKSIYPVFTDRCFLSISLEQSVKFFLVNSKYILEYISKKQRIKQHILRISHPKNHKRQWQHN